MDYSKHIPVELKKEYDMGEVEVHCPLCNIMIYDSFVGRGKYETGLFDLSKSKFCPNCGVKFQK